VAQASEASLAERLRALRRQYRVTQQQVATVLGVSTGLISSWESGAAVPSAERLRDYALAFASEDTFDAVEPHLRDEAELSSTQERHRQDLIDELVRLRDLALRPPGARSPGRGALGGRFWYFPDGAPIRIITTPIWPSLEKDIPYVDPWHPNYVQAFRDMDRDATIELVSHIRAENPATDVRFMTADDATRDDLIKHVVVLGQCGEMPSPGAEPHPESEFRHSVMQYLLRRLELPVGARTPADRSREFDSEFVVTADAEGKAHWYPPHEPPSRIEAYRPRFVREGSARQIVNGYPTLEYDVALLARKRNELNRSATVTWCSGIFSRGTFGAVRALTDATLRARNEQFLLDHFGGLEDFWMLFYVPVFQSVNGLETITPDLERPFHRLRDSQGGADEAQGSDRHGGEGHWSGPWRHPEDG
jgi:transcriptional regulator with XRE-family HTH domain